MKRYPRYALLGAVTGASLMSQSPYANAGETIRCIKKPHEYRLHHQCTPKTYNMHHGGPYTS